MTVKHITLRIEQFTKGALKYLLKKAKRFTASFRGNIKQILILSLIALIGFTLLYWGYKKASPEDFTNGFTLPASYTLLGLVPGLFFVDTVSKRILELRERVDYGLKNKKILLAGDKEECNNVEAQLAYSQLYDKKNITNISANRTLPEQTHNSGNFTKYDLVILCFTGTNFTPITDQQAELLSETLSTIGHDKTVKDEIKVNNSDKAVTGLIILCPLQSLKELKDLNTTNTSNESNSSKMIFDLSKHIHDTEPFTRPFTVVVNQAGRLLTDVFSLLTTLPPRY
ncbi:hypothetical protein [Actinomyces sp.]